jgi:hypothetical protein
MPTHKFPNFGKKPKHCKLEKALVIFEKTRKASKSFYNQFKKSRASRAGGSTTDEEQDLLRAMLLFSSSGLDAIIKQLIKDALPSIIDVHDGAQKEFQKYIERRLKKSGNGTNHLISRELIDTKYLAEVLSTSTPKQVLINDLVCSLLEDSLQSKDQLLRVAAYFAIPKDELIDNQIIVNEIFQVRNQITHEMDIDLNSPNRSRRGRGQQKMINYADNLLNIARKFINAVFKRLPPEK